MKIFKLGMLLCLLALFALTACENNEDPYDPPGEQLSNFSVNSNGSFLQMYDARVIGIGDVFYVDDQTIFYLSAKLMRKDLNGITYFQLVPDSLACAADGCLIVDQSNQKLYFIGNGDLYSCGFWGENLENLTPGNSKSLAEPHLSGDGRFITMVGRIGSVLGAMTTYDLETGALTEYSDLPRAWEAFYNHEYGSFVYRDQYEFNIINSDGSNLVNLMTFRYYFDMQQSFDGRYIFAKAQPQDNFADTLWVYDYDQHSLLNRGRTVLFEAAANRNVFYAVQRDNIKAQLVKVNLDTGGSDVIFRNYEDYYLSGAYFLKVRSDEGRIYVKGIFGKENKGLLR